MRVGKKFFSAIKSNRSFRSFSLTNKTPPKTPPIKLKKLYWFSRFYNKRNSLPCPYFLIEPFLLKRAM
ncbi:MAG TPA: hypothetical protein DCK76_03505 [Desulfotomaculum sp.]|nr:hypothetical protein [Desulfotomaculum sp.]